MDNLFEEYKDIFSLHKCDIGHTTLLTMDIDEGDHSFIVYKHYPLPQKPSQWVWEELAMLELVLYHMFIVIIPKKVQPEQSLNVFV